MLKHGYWLFEYTSISKIILKRTTKYAYAYLNSEHTDLIQLEEKKWLKLIKKGKTFYFVPADNFLERFESKK